MSLLLKLDDGTLMDYRTWYDAHLYKSAYEYHTACGMVMYNSREVTPGCAHANCALEAARQNLPPKGLSEIFNTFVFVVMCFGLLIMWRVTLLLGIIFVLVWLWARSLPVNDLAAANTKSAEQIYAELSEYTEKGTINGHPATEVDHTHNGFFYPPVPLE